MTSLENMNETTKNLLKALAEYVPPIPKKIVIKLLYDEITGDVYSFTFEDTDKPFIEISREQYNANLHLKKLKVIDGKLVEIKKDHSFKLPLVNGTTWFTTSENMLIIGKEKGWDARTNS